MQRWTSCLSIIFVLLVLVGCEGDYSPPITAYKAETGFSIHFTYPYDGMREFPITGSIIVSFTDKPHPNTGDEALRLERLDETGALFNVAVTVVATGHSLLITPLQTLQPLSEYRLTISPEIFSAEGLAAEIPAEGLTITFKTLAERPLAGVAPDVSTVRPDPETQTAYDFQTFRVYFTEPIDRRTIRIGETLLLTDAEGNVIDGDFFVRSNQVAFDPAADLTPGSYILTLTTGILDAGGESLASERTYTFEVVSTQPRSSMVIENCPTLGDRSSCAPVNAASELPRHGLTGDDANAMLVDSILLGPSRAYLSGQLQTEMADTALDPKAIPIVIRKGQRLYATSIDSQLGGEIPTGLETGECEIHILTDAVGLLSETPTAGARPKVTMTLDAAVTPLDSAAGMMISQILLGTHLEGFAYVDEDSGKLVLEVAGIAEFFILGERIRTQMSLRMVDAGYAEAPEPDTTAPSLRMTEPLRDETNVRLGTAIKVLFNEPVTPASTAATVSLRTGDGEIVAVDILNNGPKLLIVPRDPLQPFRRYHITIEPGLCDVCGNATTGVITRSFTTGPREWSAEPPIVVTTSPGNGNDLAAFPGHMPIEIWFSQIMDRDSVILGDTFQVVDLSENSTVPGTLIYFFQRVSFFPNEPFIAGHTYRIVLTAGLTSQGGVGLDLDGDHQPGGADGQTELWINFTAIEANDWVPLRLMLSPAVDVDGSGYVSANEVVSGTTQNTFDIVNPLLPGLSHAAGYMMTYVKGLAYDETGLPFLDIEIAQGLTITSTSLKLDLSFIFRLLRELFGPDAAEEFARQDGLFAPLGRLTIIAPQNSPAPAVESPRHDAQMNIAMYTRITADNDYMNGLLEDELILEATGGLSFTSNGLLQVDISGLSIITANLVIPLVNITIPIPLPTLINLTAVSRHPLSWWNTF